MPAGSEGTERGQRRSQHRLKIEARREAAFYGETAGADPEFGPALDWTACDQPIRKTWRRPVIPRNCGSGGSLSQLRYSPLRRFGKHRIGIARPLLEDGQESDLPTVAHRDRQIAAKP
jgi:hypothetical protein